MKTLGLIGGMSWESTALYYRQLNEGVQERLGGLHSARLLLWSCDFQGVADRQEQGRWDEIALEMVSAAKALEAAGAEALLLCSNTIHKVASSVEREVSIPLLHIAAATGSVLRANQSVKPALLATRYTMEQDFYKDYLREHYGLDVLIPDEPGRKRVHRIIFEELCKGVIRPESKQIYLKEAERLIQQGADALILGCTEISLLLKPEDFTIPVYDTTTLHVTAALDFALN